MLRLWRVAMTAAAGALAAGNIMRCEDEGEIPRIVAYALLGTAWALAGAWVWFGCERDP